MLSVCSTVAFGKSPNSSGALYTPALVPFEHADIGAIFGIGFPPFRGGPFRMVDSMGAQKLCDTMMGYADAHGDHFLPAPILLDYAKAGKKFHA